MSVCHASNYCPNFRDNLQPELVGFERKGVAISFPMQQTVTVPPFKVI